MMSTWVFSTQLYPMMTGRNTGPLDGDICDLSMVGNPDFLMKTVHLKNLVVFESTKYALYRPNKTHLQSIFGI